MSRHLKHIDTLTQSVETLERQLLDLDYEGADPPRPNCSCHLRAPCADCTAYGKARARCEERREAVSDAVGALAALRTMSSKRRRKR